MAIKELTSSPCGIVEIPPSKSLSHRAVVCMSLAGGDPAGIENLGQSEDIAATLAGVSRILRAGGNGGVIDCGESGSTLRFLIPVAAMTGGEWSFTGRGRLLGRPQDVYEKIFRDRGAVFVREEDRIRIRGPLPAGRYELPGDVSSQFITGLLFAFPLTGGDCVIALTTPLESADYIELTTNTMRAFGVPVEKTRDADGRITGWRVPGKAGYRRTPFRVEGDWSQAAFFLCAGALGADVGVSGLNAGSAQGDRRVAEILERMGAVLSSTGGVTRARPSMNGLRGTEIDARDIPDIVPPLAALACFAKGTTLFTGAGRLRLKESDRIAALAEELAKLGAGIEETPDGLCIAGKDRLKGGDVCAHGDHRIAMALAVASLGCEGSVRLDGAECVGKSYPGFWEDWERK